MTRNEFKVLTEHYCYLDGATGSNLVKAGMPVGVCPEQWILDNPEVMLSLQKEYVKAGTDILYAPTFTANRVKLAEYGLEDRQGEMIRKLVAISKEAAGSCTERKVYVAGDLTMTGRQLRPMGDMDIEELIAIYKEQVLYLAEAGADLVVAETMMSLGEARAAVIAVKEIEEEYKIELPIMVTMTFEPDGRTLYGTDAVTAAVVLESLGVCALGVNCSAGPAHMEQIIRDMISVTGNIPVIAKPNAGLPFLDGNGKTCYSMDAEEFVSEMQVLTNAGATILGGCCGTTPDFIRGLHSRYGKQQIPSFRRRYPHIHYLTSERSTVSFGLDGRFLIVGERINPTGKKKLQEKLREGKMDMVLQFAEEQEAAGAAILDINMGMSGIDEKEMMLRSIEEVSGVTNLPLSLDSSHVEVLEAALRSYPGRALINSISFEKEKYEKLLPIAKKYGAMFILLPLSDKGLPENLQEKIDIIQTMLKGAYEIGLTSEDIIVDGLVTTVGANRRAAIETLETIRFCKENGLATICGLSNISFGMPERMFVNTAFLTLAIREGLTMAIANPSQELLVCGALAADLLLAKEDADIRYIESVNEVAARRQAKAEEERQKLLQKGDGIPAVNGDSQKAPVSPGGSDVESTLSEPLQKLYHAVLKGNRGGTQSITQAALDAGEEAGVILNSCLLPAINEVGELFDKGKYFLPQLIGSAEAMKKAIEVLEPLLLKDSAGEDMPVVVIATVEGDIHDIGKNLVALMLKNYGFQVIDLGKDVPKEEIIRVAKEKNAKIIALSALMTTTMQRMKEVIAYAREKKVSAKVMIGGAVITQEYADEIGADGYSADAADAVKLAKRLITE
ncbi:MAG: homocysteine S-methyltransferase family protein [Acetatifactor sp.]|nr:homocysteine S-methyltransferase family protein [Acetatifactor sp.]